MRALSPRMRVTGFHHLAIQVRDVEATARFYREALGLPELARHAQEDGSLRSIWLGLGDGFFALERAGGTREREPFRTDRPGLHLVALRIPAAERSGAMAELARRGVAIEHETKWTFYFRDPEGNRVALSHHPEDAA